MSIFHRWFFFSWSSKAQAKFKNILDRKNKNILEGLKFPDEHDNLGTEENATSDKEEIKNAKTYLHTQAIYLSQLCSSSPGVNLLSGVKLGV